MSFDTEAFLSEDAQKDRDFIKDGYKDIFSIAKETNLLTNDIKFNLEIFESNPKHILIGCLFVKIIQSFNSTIILYEHGLEFDAKALSRVLLENAMNLVAINNSDAFMKFYIAEEDFLAIDKARCVRKRPDCFSKAVVDTYKNFDIDAKTVRALRKHGLEKRGGYSKKQIANKAKMADLYYNAYITFCSDVHSDINSVKSAISEINDTIMIDILPKFNHIELVLATNINIMLRVLLTVNNISKKDYKVEINGLDCKVKTYMNSPRNKKLVRTK